MLDKITKNAINKLIDFKISDYNNGTGYSISFDKTCSYEAVLNRQDIFISFNKGLIYKNDLPIIKIRKRYGKHGKMLKPILETL